MAEAAVNLLRRLVACDTSNPPGKEAQAAAVLQEFLTAAGVRCERVARDEERPNLVARLRGDGTGPTFAFLGHLDVVPARREDWSVDPFAGVLRDGEIWGRGTIDMKCQLAAVSVALAELAREGFRPRGDVLLLAVADEEVGAAEVGAPWLVQERPDLRPDFLVGEGAGERLQTPSGPVYLLDRGVKGSARARVRVRGIPGDASLPSDGGNAAYELARLLMRLRDYESPTRVVPDVKALLAVANGDGEAPLRELVDALTTNVLTPTAIDAVGAMNVVPSEAVLTVYCAVVPGTTRDDLERELQAALGEGSYELDVDEPQGGLTSPLDTPLSDAIRSFLAEHDPEARLVPALGYGFSDCHVFREAFGTVAYGFIPFRHADPRVNLTTKHGADERVRIDDLRFQVDAARHLARTMGAVER